jgi:hypothetical protein
MFNLAWRLLVYQFLQAFSLLPREKYVKIEQAQ